MSGVLFELAFVLIYSDRLNQSDLSIGQLVRLDWNVSKKQTKNMIIISGRINKIVQQVRGWFFFAKITYYLSSLPPVKNTIEVRDAIC